MSHRQGNKEDLSRLLDFYPHAITDFYYSSHELCVYKTGPEWPVNKGPEAYKIVRNARPIYDHPIAPIWLKTARTIVATLDSLNVKFNSINPVGYADAGKATLLCDFIIKIGVQPVSLTFADAVVAGTAIEKILQDLGFPDIQIAFVESVYHRYGTGPKVLHFHPMPFRHVGLAKPFAPTLSLPIAPLASPDHEGSGGLFFRLSADEADKRVALLTCAHVVRPPQTPGIKNEAYTRTNETDPRQDIILLGDGAYKDTIKSIEVFIRVQKGFIYHWERQRASQPVEAKHGGPIPVPAPSSEEQLISSINEAKSNIKCAEELLTTTTETFKTEASRVIGFVLHSSRIEVGDDDFISDWSFVQLDEDAIDWKGAMGNRLFVGGNSVPGPYDWISHFHLQPDDHSVLSDRFDSWATLELSSDFVPEAEFRHPQTYDVYNVKTLMAVKNGCSTGTTYGRVNGLESITRSHYHVPASEDQDGKDTDIVQDALEFMVCGYDTRYDEWAVFSDMGDSGAFAVDRDGRLIGQITGGTGGTGIAEKTLGNTYITPYFALKKRIEKEYPGAHLL